MSTVLEFNRAAAVYNGSLISEIAGTPELPEFSFSGYSSNSAHGANVELPYRADPDGVFEITFKREHTGTWYDNDFTDARLYVEFRPLKDPGEVTYNSGSWLYYRTNTPTTDGARIDFRSIVGQAFGASGDGTVTQMDAPTCDLAGTVTTKLRVENRNGKMRIKVYTGASLTLVFDSVCPYADGLFIAHYHNYSRNATERLIDVAYSVPTVEDYTDLLLEQQPLALYPCQNDVPGGVLDASGNSYHMTASTNPLYIVLNNDTNPEGGTAHEVLDVDAVGTFACELDSYVQDMAIYGDLTLSVMFKLKTLPGYNIYCITMAGNGETSITNILYSLWFTSGGDHMIPYVFQESGAGVNETIGFSGLRVYPNQWYHIALRRNAATKTYTCFVNGERLVKTYANTLTDPGGSGQQHLTVGGTLSGQNQAGHFAFSHLAIFDYPLTDEQLYRQYKAGMVKALADDYAAAVLEQSPDHLWTLTDAAASGTAADAIDTASIDLTVGSTDMVTFEATTSPLQLPTAQFNAVTHDVLTGPWPLISAQPAGDIVREGSASVAFLYRQDRGDYPTFERSFVFTLAGTSEAESANHILTFWPTNVGAPTGTRLPYILMEYTTGANIALTGTTPLPIGQWLHIAIVVDVTALQCTLYVNGVPEVFDMGSAPSIADTGNIQQLIFGGNNSLLITPHYTAAMAMAQFGWWNRTLSQFEILEQVELLNALLDSATTLESKLTSYGAVTYLPLQEESDTFADVQGALNVTRITDVVGSDNGPATGGPRTLERSQLITAVSPLHLINTAAVPYYLANLGSVSSPFCVGFWFKANAAFSGSWFQELWYSDRTLVELRQESLTSNVPFSIGNVGHKLSFGMASGHVSGIGRRFSATSLADIDDGAWHFLAVTRDGASLTLYVDDTSQSFTADNVDCSLGTTTANFTLGCRTTNTGTGDAYTAGNYAGLFIVQEGLDATQVEELRALSLAIELPPVGQEDVLFIDGTVSLDGIPTRATLALYDSETYELVSVNESDQVDGTYRFTSTDTVKFGDPHWDAVAFMAPMSEGIVDVSNNAAEATIYDEPAIVSTRQLFDRDTCYFTGTGYVTFPSTPIDVSKFTLEGWVYLEDYTRYMAVVTTYNADLRNDPGVGIGLHINDGTGTVYFATYGNGAVASIIPCPTGQWVHLAGVFDGTYRNIFMDGVLVGRDLPTKAILQGDLPWMLGWLGYSVKTHSKGWIADVRVTSGVARYPSEAVPTAPLPTAGTVWTPVTPDAVLGGNDLHIDKVTSLILFDSTEVVDLVDPSRNVTVTGTLTADSATPVGAPSVRMDKDTYIEVATATEMWRTEEPWTMEFWMKWNSDSGTQYEDPLSFGNSLASYAYFLLRASNTSSRPYIYLGDDGSIDWDNTFVISNYPIPSDTFGVWHHHVIQSDGRVLTFWFDGAPIFAGVDADSATGESRPIKVPTLEFMRFGGVLARDADISFSEFRLTKGVARYSAPFVPSRIDTSVVSPAPRGPSIVPNKSYFILCNYGYGIRPLAHGPIVPTVLGTEPEPPTEATYAEIVAAHPGLTALWMLDEPAAATTFVPTVGSNTFIISGAPPVEIVSAPIIAGTTGARNFDGNVYYGNYVGTPAEWRAQRSLELWFRNNVGFPGGRDFQAMFDAYTSNSDRGGINRQGVTPYRMPYPWCSGDSVFDADLTPITDSEIHHLVLVRETNVTDKTKVWIDGAQQSDILDADFFGYGGDYITVGCYRYNSTYGDQSYDGSLAGLALYDTPLSAEEIFKHYRKGKGLDQSYQAIIEDDSPVDYWPLTAAAGGAGVVLPSAVGVAVATLGGDAVSGSAPLVGEGSSVALAATASYVGLSGAATLSTNYTLEAWINVTASSPTNYAAIIFGADAGFYYYTTGYISYFYSGQNHQSTATGITAGKPHHVAISVNNGVGTFYVNGVARGTCSGCPAVTPVAIGRQTIAGTHQFNGKIDQVATYDRALTITEIKRHYHAGLARSWTPLELGAALVRWYDADDRPTATWTGTGVSQLVDKSPAKIHAVQASTSLQPTWPDSGKMPGHKVLSFDGSSEYMSADSAVAGTDLAVFSVSQARYTVQDRHGIVSEWTTGASPGQNEWFLAHGSALTSKPRFVVEIGATSYVAEHSTALVDQFVILGGTHDGTDAVLYVNGAESATTPALGAVNSVPERKLIVAGYDNAANGYFTAPTDIGEIIILNAVPTTEDRQKIEGYLAHKWGLTGNLSVDHPYKYTPPVV